MFLVWSRGSKKERFATLCKRFARSVIFEWMVSQPSYWLYGSGITNSNYINLSLQVTPEYNSAFKKKIFSSSSVGFALFPFFQFESCMVHGELGTPCRPLQNIIYYTHSNRKTRKFVFLFIYLPIAVKINTINPNVV